MALGGVQATTSYISTNIAESQPSNSLSRTRHNAFQTSLQHSPSSAFVHYTRPTGQEQFFCTWNQGPFICNTIFLNHTVIGTTRF